MSLFFFFNDTATTEIYTLSLHDALPICPYKSMATIKTQLLPMHMPARWLFRCYLDASTSHRSTLCQRSEEHTSELQSRQYLVCRLLLEKKKKIIIQK